MKHNHNHDNAPSTEVQLVPVRFEFTHSTAVTVAVAGSFNAWHPTTKSIHCSGDGHWSKETALAPGTYEYCLVVDGKWMPDPLAHDQVSNPFGGKNSLLQVASSPGATHFADAKNLPLKNTNTKKDKHE
jgi:1,4-alpha-glucan branching enzyme